MSDLISRADAIKAVAIAVLDDRDELEAIKALPSAEGGDAEMDEVKPQYMQVSPNNGADLISRELAMERIANDNVVGGMERIHEYNNSTELNEYLDGISDAITTIFCDVPSAEAVSFEDAMEIRNTILFKEYMRGRRDAEAVQGDAISKRFISDAILQKISELNAQGEKAIPIAREFIRFKRFVDGITPIRAEAVQGEWTYLSGLKGSYMTISCPICGSTFDGVAEWKYHYCPNCGARMKGGDSE